MNHIRLDNVLFPEARTLKFKSSVHSLAKTINGEDVYSQINRPSGKCLVLSVNLDRSDLAFRTAFPIMVANALGWFSGTNGELQPSVATGTLAPLTVSIRSLLKANPAAAESSSKGLLTKLVAPTGAESKLPVSVEPGTDPDVGTILAGPLNAPGIWQAVPDVSGPGATPSGVSAESAEADDDASDRVLASIAVNLADERETDLRPNPALLALQSKSSIAENWFSRPLWYYLALLAAVLTCVEWFLFQRRWIA